MKISNNNSKTNKKNGIPNKINFSKSSNNSLNSKDSNNDSDINDNFNNISKSCYIQKIRKINLLKHILLLQRNIRNFIKKRIYIKKPYLNMIFISKSRLNIITYNKFLKHIEESKAIIKLDKNNSQNNSINIQNIFLITKTRYLNFIPNIETIQRNWRLKLESKITYKKTKQKVNYITKNRIKNNDNEITMIQNKIRNRIFVKNKTISRKIIATNSLYNKRRYSKEKNKINDNKGSKNKINKKLKQNMENYLNNNKLNKLNKLYKKQESNSFSSNCDSNSNSAKSFSKKEFSNAKINYISKIYKLIIYKRQVNSVGNFVSKEYKVEIKKKKNYSFLKLLCLFITKDMQEYVFYLLKYNTEKTFLYPFYINTLQRILKYLRSSKNNSTKSELDKENNTNIGEKIKKLFSKIFPSLYTGKTPLELISSLNSQSKEIFINTNIYNSIEPDLINFINDFSKYDKNISNNVFIETRLKHTKLINTNIFTIVKFIDDEYSYLIYGKYCTKCFLEKNKCSCDKNNNEYYYTDVDNILDIEFDPYYSNKNKIEYDSIKWKDTSIKRKPNIEEGYEDPITHIILRNKEKEKFNKDNLNDSFYGTNANSSYNSNKVLNKIKNDFEENSFINKIKSVYHQNNITKKENLILIKNNDY